MDIYDWISRVELQSIDTVTVWEAFKSAISNRWMTIAENVEALRKTLDPAIWLFGSLLALLPGSYAIYKWWYFRDSRLPLRLNEILARDEVRLRKSARRALRQAVENPDAPRARVAVPVFAVPKLQTTIRNLNWAGWLAPFPFNAAERELEAALDEIEKQLEFNEKSRVVCKKQQAVAFLIKGAILAARANDNSAADSADQVNREALNYFIQALEIDGTDIEALEYVARQQYVLGQNDLALTSFSRLIGLTENSSGEAKLVTARAYRYRAEILEAQYDRTKIRLRLTDARDNLEKSILHLPMAIRGQLEHAVTLEALGRVLEKIGVVGIHLNRYSEALAIYAAVLRKKPNNREASAGVNRMASVVERNSNVETV